MAYVVMSVANSAAVTLWCETSGMLPQWHHPVCSTCKVHCSSAPHHAHHLAPYMQGCLLLKTPQ